MSYLDSLNSSVYKVQNIEEEKEMSDIEMMNHESEQATQNLVILENQDMVVKLNV